MFSPWLTRTSTQDIHHEINSDYVAEQKDMKGHDNQQVVYRSKKPTDSSSNSMKGAKISILSGPLNSMALGLLFLDECDDRQQGQERTATWRSL